MLVYYCLCFSGNVGTEQKDFFLKQDYKMLLVNREMTKQVNSFQRWPKFVMFAKNLFA